MSVVLKRFLAIGDVHAEDVRLERALLAERDAGVEVVLSVGDLVDGHGDARRALRLLRDARAIAARGNHDRWLLEGARRASPHATPSEANSRLQDQLLHRAKSASGQTARDIALAESKPASVAVLDLWQ